MEADRHCKPASLSRRFTKPSSISSVLKCIICTEVFVEPMRLFCGHTFCQECIAEWIKASGKCPVCRQDIDRKNISADLMAGQIIDELEVYCPSTDCPWKGQLELMEIHFKYECELVQKTSQKKPKHKERKHIHMPVQQVDEDVEQKINENTNKGSLLARVFHKNQDQNQSATWLEKTRSLMVGGSKVEAANPDKHPSSETKTRKGKLKKALKQKDTDAKQEDRKNEDIDFLLELYQ